MVCFGQSLIIHIWFRNYSPRAEGAKPATCSRAAYINGSVHDCSISSALAMEILQYCTKPSVEPLRIAEINSSSINLVGLRAMVYWQNPYGKGRNCSVSWWRHQMKRFPALLALCEGNPPMVSPHKGQWRGALMFLWSAPEQTIKQTIETPVICDNIALIVWHHCDEAIHAMRRKFNFGEIFVTGYNESHQKGHCAAYLSGSTVPGKWLQTAEVIVIQVQVQAFYPPMKSLVADPPYFIPAHTPA